MSIVINVVSENISWLAYDGRAAQGGIVINENQKKAVKINNKVCLGFTGTVGAGESLISKIKELYGDQLPQIGSDDVAITACRIIDTVKQSLEADNIPVVNENIVITGINSDGRMASYTMGSFQPFRGYVPNGNNDRGDIVLTSDHNTLNISPYIDRELARGLHQNVAVLRGIENYIYDVAKIDPTINTNIETIMIRR